MGSINGRVAPLGGSLPAGVRIVLDDHRRIPVDATGRFTVKKVEQGSHRLRLDLTRVPAEWGAVVQEAEAIVRPGKPALVSFQVQRLASITGSVATLSPLPPDLAAVHPLNNLVISLKDSRRTTTDEEGHFHFDNLPAGTYIAELAETAVPDGFKPAGPTRWVLKVAPGGKVTDANFTLERKERPIIYTDLDSGESTSSTQAAAVAPRTNQGPAPDQAATLWPKPDTGGSNSRPSGTASQPPAQPIASVQGTANPG